LPEPSPHAPAPAGLDAETDFGLRPAPPSIDVPGSDSRPSSGDQPTVHQPPPPGAIDTLSGVDPEAPTLQPDVRPTAGALPSSKLRSGSSGGLRSSKLADRADGEGPPTEGKIYAGKYELLEEIARGGMGVVYKARQIDLNRIVALKVMLSGSMAGEEERRRFILEAEASARLKHPNIVPVFDIGEVGGNLYFTMDYVEGEPLSRRKNELSREELLDVMIQVADGVAYAHQRGIIHRDLKPANIMMTADGVPQIMDFGLAKQVEVADESGAPSLQTRDGAVMGTPHYMPPEQAEGKVSEIDVRSDVYALGVILYELWTGELPFTARSLTELLFKIFDTDPRPPRQVDPSIDWDMEAIILKAIEKPKEKRYQSAQELKEDLERVRDGLPVTARRATVVYRLSKWSRRNRRGILAASVVLGLLAVTAGLAYRSLRQEQILAEQRYRDLIAETEALARTLAGERDALLEREQAFAKLADFSERRRRLPELLGALADLRQRAVEARARLEGSKQRPEAAPLDRRLAELEGDLTARSERLERLREVQTRLAQAEEAVGRARALSEQVVRSAAGDAQGASETEVHRYPDLASALEGRAVAASADALAGRGKVRSFRTAADTAQRELFVALGLAGQERWPERAQAQERIQALAALRQKVEGALERARRLQTARLLSNEARAVLAALARAPAGDGAQRLLRLRAARRAQELVRRAGEASPGFEGLSEVRFDANRAYAQALLDLQAYPVLDVELQSPDQFRPADLAALKEAKEKALAATRALRDELEGMRRKLAAGADRQTLRTLVARLRALEGDRGLDAKLEATRSDLLGRAQTALEALVREEALRDLARKSEKARSLAGSGDEAVASLDERLAAWDEVARAARKAEQLLGKAVTDATLRTCRLEQGRAAHDAALAYERSDPVRALELAERAQAYYAQLPAGDPEAERRRALLEGLVRRLRRVREKPEGMVLLPGRRNVELGSSAAERNPPRRVDVAPFYLAQREVSRREYAQFLVAPEYTDPAFWKRLGADPKHVAPWPLGWEGKQPPPGTEDLPVTGISWDEARGYARFRGMRLPRDDEWEYAVRYHGEAVTTYPWGEEWRDDVLARSLKPSGSNPADRTPEGVFDLAGNVSEWTAIARARGRRGEAELHPSARGASFLYPEARIARGTYRLKPRADYRGPQLGLRLAKGAR
ncbi:MAG: hypothetical protein D6731_00200, partial [Planctomycetota bacterium]